MRARPEFDLGGDGQLFQAVHVFEADALPQRPQGHRAIHRAGINISEAEPAGQAFSDRALPRARRAVDRNHYSFGFGVCQEIE